MKTMTNMSITIMTMMRTVLTTLIATTNTAIAVTTTTIMRTAKKSTASVHLFTTAFRPFNQDKLQQFVENWPKSVVRAKGVLWFDDKREDVYVFEQAGVQITATEQGKWLAAFPKKQQKLYLAEYPDMAEK